MSRTTSPNQSAHITKDYITRMAQAAGLWPIFDNEKTKEVIITHINLERFAELIAAAEREAWAQKAAQWQPIETAPKDGTKILIFAEGVVTEAHYDIDYWKPIWLDVHGCGCCGGDNPKPTHWAPLQKPQN